MTQSQWNPKKFIIFFDKPPVSVTTIRDIYYQHNLNFEAILVCIILGHFCVFFKALVRETILYSLGRFLFEFFNKIPRHFITLEILLNFSLFYCSNVLL